MVNNVKWLGDGWIRGGMGGQNLGQVHTQVFTLNKRARSWEISQSTITSCIVLRSLWVLYWKQTARVKEEKQWDGQGSFCDDLGKKHGRSVWGCGRRRDINDLNKSFFSNRHPLLPKCLKLDSFSHFRHFNWQMKITCLLYITYFKAKVFCVCFVDLCGPSDFFPSHMYPDSF